MSKFPQIASPLPFLTRVALVTSTALSLCLTPALAATKVGVASAVIPQASIGDTMEALKIVAVGDAIDQDVIVQTGPRGRTQVLFVDGSSMNIGPSSRLVIDNFVFDAEQLDGKLSARMEKGSMRFIGGVLSKRANQVSFTAGEATVGIRGGIAKLAVDAGGRMQAQLVHGSLSVRTPEGLYETTRVGTLIERSETGSVATRSVSAAEEKQGIDAEAKESFVEPEALATSEPDEGSREAQSAPQSTAQTPAETAAEPVVELTAETRQTGDVLVDDPLEAGLVELDADGKLKASAELADIDPEAAKLIDSGAIAINQDGEIVPTAQMIELDDAVKDMVDQGLLSVDADGFLVPTERFEASNLYADVSSAPSEQNLISEVTLSEFSYEAPIEIRTEEQYKSNISATQAVLSTDANSAKLYELGQLEVDAFGLLKPSKSFNPLLVARANTSALRETGVPRSYIKDSASDQMLLTMGSFDTKVTTRVVGVARANNFYSENVTRVVSADIVRDDALSRIDRLAAANGIGLPEDIQLRSLKDLVSMGGALSTSDALQARFGKNDAANVSQNLTMDMQDGEVLLRSQLGNGEALEVKAEDAYQMFLQSKISQVGADAAAGESTGLMDFLKSDDFSISKIEQIGARVEAEEGLPDVGARENILNEIIIDKGEALKARFGINEEASLDISGFDEKADFSSIYDKGFAIDKVKDAGEEAFADGFADEFLAGVDVPQDYKSLVGKIDVPFLDVDDRSKLDLADLLAKNEQQRRELTEEVNEKIIENITEEALTRFERLARLLSSLNANFATALHAVTAADLTALEDKDGNYTPGVTTNDILSLSAQSNFPLCNCDQISTGLWTTEAFTDGVADNLTYQHQGHWAIGQPLSADTIQSLVGMAVVFSGHAYGSVTTANSTGTGFGSVAVNMDFANPTNAAANTWQLINFAANNLGGPVNAEVTLATPNVTAQSSEIAYSGSNATTTVSGALYGTTRNLQTAGTFKVTKESFTIRGSFAGSDDSD